MEIKGAKINFLGDSITEGCGTYRFTDVIADEFGAVSRNYGIGGTRIAVQKKPSAFERWDLDFCGRVSEMDPDADVVIVFGGTNDFGHGDAPVGCMTDRTPDTFYGALHTLYTSLIEKYPTAKIVVLTPLHRCNEDNTRGEGYKEESLDLKGYVNVIREVAEFYSLPVLDLFAESGLQPCVPVIKERYMPDGLHPNTDGHHILAEKIVRFIQAL